MAVTGVNAITTSFVKDYGRNIGFLVQQMGSVLRPCVLTENFTGESAAVVEQFGEVTAKLRTERHADTPLIPVPFDRRWAFVKHWETADLIDQQDRLEQIIDPTSPFAQVQAMALGRAMDDEIIDRFLGINKTGQNAETDVAFPASQVVDDGGGVTTAMTIDKLREAREKFLDANVDLDRETVYAAITPRQQTQLLQTTEVTDADYNTVRALVNGEVNTFMGFTFKVSNRLLGATKYGGTQSPIAAGAESAMFFSERGMKLGIWNDINTRITERDDKSYATQVYCKASFGATRMQEDKCIRVDTLKNP